MLPAVEPGGDIRAASVEKLMNLTHGKFYRARLDDSDRLVFALVRHGGETCSIRASSGEIANCPR